MRVCDRCNQVHAPERPWFDAAATGAASLAGSGACRCRGSSILVARLPLTVHFCRASTTAEYACATIDPWTRRFASSESDEAVRFLTMTEQDCRSAKGNAGSRSE